jgi:plastocyanin
VIARLSETYISVRVVGVVMVRKSISSDRSGDDGHIARRGFVAAVGAGAVVGLAGCVGGDGTAAADAATPTESGGEGGSGNETGTPTETGSEGWTGLDAQFGFVGATPEAPAPVEHDHEVQLLIGEREDAPVPEFYFEPSGLFVEAGSVVKFVLATPDHTVTAYHPSLARTQRVPDGVPAISSPVLGGGTYWLYRFETPGAYDLYCAPHEPYGMAMRLVVGEATGPGAEPVSTEEPAHGDPRPPFGTSATVLSDPALDPERIVEAGSVPWEDISAESKRVQM